LISLLLLFSFIVLTLLPRAQQQLALRAEVNFEDYIIPVKGRFQTGAIVIFKIILNLD
jgi:hypothetical protein